MESRKKALMNLFAGKEWRHRSREWTCGHGEGKGGMNWESSADRYTLSNSEKLLHSAESPVWRSDDLEWDVGKGRKYVCVCVCVCVCCVCGLVTKLCLTLATQGTVAHQAPLSMGFFRQEYWSGLPFSSPGNLPNLGIKPGFPVLQVVSCTAGRFFVDWATREAHIYLCVCVCNYEVFTLSFGRNQHNIVEQFSSN